MQPKVQPLKPKNPTADAPQRTTKPETHSDKKPGTLDWSKAKPKAEPSEPAVSIKKDPSPVPPTKKAAPKDWFKPKQAATGQAKPEQPKTAPVMAPKPEVAEGGGPQSKTGPSAPEGASIKDTLSRTKASGTTAKPASKQSTARPASKQFGSMSAKASFSAPVRYADVNCNRRALMPFVTVWF